MNAIATGPLPPVDGHVHLVGTGAGGTGCFLRLEGRRTLLYRYLLWHTGLGSESLRHDFDRLYVDHLLEQVRTSALGAVCLLAHEHARDDNGTPLPGLTPFYVPNDYVLELGRRHPEFLPVVAIHPARSDALEELERCLAHGAVMLKLLPACQNVRCSAKRFTRFWEKMAEHGLPLLAHTGGELMLPVACRAATDPRELELPLQIGVKIIAAHCATRSVWWERDYLTVLVEMMERYPNLYADNSAFNTPNRSAGIRRSLCEPLAARLVHGSDYPVPVHGWWPWLRGCIAWRACVRAARQGNLLQRDYELKRACGYPPETFTRLWSLLRIIPPRAPVDAPLAPTGRLC